MDSVGVENCPLLLTKPVAVNTGLALPHSPWKTYLYAFLSSNALWTLNGRELRLCFFWNDNVSRSFLIDVCFLQFTHSQQIHSTFELTRSSNRGSRTGNDSNHESSISFRQPVCDVISPRPVTSFPPPVGVGVTMPDWRRVDVATDRRTYSPPDTSLVDIPPFGHRGHMDTVLQTPVRDILSFTRSKFVAFEYDTIRYEMLF